MSSQRKTTVDHWSSEGVFGLVIETSNQAPILMETEGDQSSREDARARALNGSALGGQVRRWCVVRLVPVDGNELLLLDMQRLQKKETEE